MMSQAYRRRMLSIVENLKAQGINPYRSAPPLYRLYWRLGWRIQPPHYQSFTTIVLSQGLLYGLSFGLILWFGFWRRQGLPVIGVILASALGGLASGLWSARDYRQEARRITLPPLNDSTL